MSEDRLKALADEIRDSEEYLRTRMRSLPPNQIDDSRRYINELKDERMQLLKKVDVTQPSAKAQQNVKPIAEFKPDYRQDDRRIERRQRSKQRVQPMVRPAKPAARPVYKPNVERTLSADESLYMDQMIEEIKESGKPNVPLDTVDRNTADAARFLSDRYETLEGLGIPARYAKDIEQVGEFNIGGRTVPDAFKVPVKLEGSRAPKDTLYIGTEFSPEANPITGQRDINPSIDPTSGVDSPRRALTMFTGDLDALETKGSPLLKNISQDALNTAKASEHVQQQVMKRMGRPVMRNNVSDEMATDFKERQRMIDGQTFNVDNPDIKTQAYTAVRPAIQEDIPGESEVDAVKRILNEEIDKNPSLTLEGIVDEAGNPLNRNRRLTGIDRSNQKQVPLPGKLFATDENKLKNEVFYTGRTSGEQNINKFYDDRLSFPPTDIYTEDIDRARLSLGRLKGEDLSRSLDIRPVSQSARNSRAQINMVAEPDIASTFRTEGKEIVRKNPEVVQFLAEDSPLRRMAASDEFAMRVLPGINNLRDTVAEGRAGGLAGLGYATIDPSVREAVDRGDARGVAETVARDVATGAAIETGINAAQQVGMKVAPQATAAVATKVAPVLGALNTVAPVTAAYAIGGSSRITPEQKAYTRETTERKRKAAEAARARGGRWKLGPVTIPDLGISEALGIGVPMPR